MELKRKIAVNERVAIIGARLSAIDAVIGLVEGGHTGPITIYSRSGFFPFVRGTQGRYKNTYLNAKNIEKHHPKLDFYKLGDLYLQERQKYLEQSEDSFFDELPLPNKPISCLKEFLSKELLLAKNNRGWQAILYDTNSCIDKIWNRLSLKDKTSFIKTYFSSSASLRVSIPVDNAQKILRYLNSGQLTFVTGASTVKVDNGLLSICNNDNNNPVDKVIYAKGSPRSLDEVDSLLIHNLHENGMINENKFGGLDVCNNDYNLFCKNRHKNTNIFAIGELTSGQFLFTSAMDIIVRHAHACADSVEKTLLNMSMSN